MKYYIIAGETSGDLHGSNLVRALKILDKDIIIQGFGGTKMREAGVKTLHDISQLSFMGFWEVLKNIRFIRKIFKEVKTDILDFCPDVLILIDYPGFNLRLAKWAKKQEIKTAYYVSPQIWAWNTGRVKGIKSSIDKMLVILPFEKQFYADNGINAVFVGHPLLDEIENNEVSAKNSDKKPIIAILPGSRKQEIGKILPILLSIIPDFPQYEFIVGGISLHGHEFYDEIVKEQATIGIDKTYDLLSKAEAAIVTSGTATLETALLNVPQVVVYKGNPFSYMLAKRLVKVKFISLVNIILGRELVKELIQNELNTQNLKNELNRVLNFENRAIIQSSYLELKEKLGTKGASENAAKEIFEMIQ